MENLKMNRKQDFFYCYNMIFNMDISSHAKLVYVYLCRCANGEAQSFPARKTIAAACSIGLTSVRYALKELEETRLLKKEEQFRDNGGQTSNLYTVYVERFEEEKNDEIEGADSNESNDSQKYTKSYFTTQPTQNMPWGMAICDSQEVRPILSKTHKEIFNNGERIRDG